MTSSLGCEYLLCACSIQVSACTPASLFQAAAVPSALSSVPPNWWSNCWKICCTGKPLVIRKPLLPSLVIAVAAASNSVALVGERGHPVVERRDRRDEEARQEERLAGPDHRAASESGAGAPQGGDVDEQGEGADAEREPAGLGEQLDVHP